MTPILEPDELRTRGFEALVKSLGWVNAVRFIHQFERTADDYTAERTALLPELSGHALLARLNAVANDFVSVISSR